MGIHPTLLHWHLVRVAMPGSRDTGGLVMGRLLLQGRHLKGLAAVPRGPQGAAFVPRESMCSVN